MKKLNLRLPDELYDILKEMADTDRRSLNSQIIVMLERAVHDRDSPPT